MAVAERFVTGPPAGMRNSPTEETKLLGREIPGSDQSVGTFLVGGSTLLARGTLLNLSLRIGLTDDADDLSITLSLPIRLSERLL